MLSGYCEVADPDHRKEEDPLSSKQITLILVPQGTNRVIQFRFPKALLVILSLFVFSYTAYLCWITKEYQSLKARIPQLEQLKKENERQKKQFVSLGKRINGIFRQMSELKVMDHKLKTMMNLELEEDEDEFFGIGGSGGVDYFSQAPITDHCRDMIEIMHGSLDVLEEEIAVSRRDKTELEKVLEDQVALLAATPSIRPTKGWISSKFGYRLSPFTGKKEFHSGLDLSNRMNTPIVAPSNGRVISIRWDPSGYGRIMTIKHGYGMVTRFAHINEALVKKGEYVKRGQKIALMGNNGRSTGPHLHYEVRLNGAPVDPLRYIQD